MKREESQKQKKKGEYSLSGEPLLDGCPLVDALLGDRWWDDGKPRVPCSLRIDLLGSGVQVTLIDGEERRSWYTLAPTVAEALGLIEDHLAGGNAAWRPWGRGK